MARPRRVLLVVMPYQNVAIAPLGVTLLATLLRSREVPVVEAYLHFDFDRLLGRQAYARIATRGARSGIAGELLFAEAYRGSTADPRIDAMLQPTFGDRQARRALVDAYRARCMAAVDAAQPDLVGFSLSFNQTSPSLWLARCIKERRPDVRIVFGGSSCSDPMGGRLVETYPEIDWLVSGYGEQPLLDLAMHGTTPPERVIRSEAPVGLDDLPVPDFAAFVDAAQRHGDAADEVMLSFESSRGCWWGEKHHCTFCGLNRLEMAFNEKSSGRVVTEVRTLWERFHMNLFATDTILSRRHLREVMPALARYDDKPIIFYEVKTNMTRAEVESLRRAHVLWIQPGIESLSTRLLRRLDKGTRSIQNVALLKWCRELGIRASWNLLCGIPGESLEDYERQLALFDLIPQLEPPGGVSPIRIDRYSPYFHAFDRYGWTAVEPLAEYRLLHPEMKDDGLRDVAYHFDGIGGSLAVADYLPRLETSIATWQRRHAAGDGLFFDRDEELVRVDGGSVTSFEAGDRLAGVIRATHEIVSITTLSEAGVDVSLIDELVDLGVLFREGVSVLNLAVCLQASSS
jgi:ribosomal peptide maturation radical SAM protein 1